MRRVGIIIRKRWNYFKYNIKIKREIGSIYNPVVE